MNLPGQITIEELEEFWDTYIGNSGETTQDNLNQIFARGIFAGYSIRELMLYSVHILGKPMPKITTERHQ